VHASFNFLLVLELLLIAQVVLPVEQLLVAVIPQFAKGVGLDAREPAADVALDE